MRKRNKKGYIRTIEAILAVLIIFAFVVTILPKKPIETGKAPPELDSTMRSILEEAQNSEEFRTCLLLKSGVVLQDVSIIGETGSYNYKNYECLNKLMEKALPIFSPWKYAFSICEGESQTCDYYSNNNVGPKYTPNINGFSLPPQKSVYTKSIRLTVPDVISKPYRVKECCNGYNPCELNKQVYKENIATQKCIPVDGGGKLLGKTIYLYLWEK